MKRYGAVLLLLLAVPSLVMAGGFALSGVGIRGLHLGGAARALFGDPYGIFWNPGGLAFSQSKTLGLYMSTVMPESRYQPTTGLVGYDGGYSNRLDIYAEAQTFNIPGFAIAIPSDLATFGLGVFVPFGLGSSWDLYEYPIGWRNPVPFPKDDWVSNLQVISAYIGLAKRFGENLAIGISGGLNFGKVELSNVHLVPADEDDPGSIPLPFSYIPVTADMSGKGTGYGAILGIAYRASEKLDLGFAARYYSAIPLDGTTNLTAYFPDSTSVGAWTLSTEAKTTADFPLPSNVGFGLAYHSSPDLTFYADLDYTLWSVVDVITLKMEGTDFFGQPLEDEHLAKQWENTARASFGLEYRYTPEIALRLGVYFDQSPIPEGSQDPLIPDIGDKLSFNGGFSYTKDLGMGKITFYLGGEYVTAPDRTVYDFQDINQDGTPDNMPGIYSMQVGAVNFGITVSY